MLFLTFLVGHSAVQVGCTSYLESIYMGRMLPGEAKNSVGMNRSVREGKKCKAL